MKTMLKKSVCVLLALVTSLSVFSLAAFAEYDPLGNLYVTDILRDDVVPATRTVRTLYINYAHQFANFNASIGIRLLDEDGNTYANVIPKSADAHYFDFYDLAGNLGVQVTLEHEYTLLIPQGALYIAGSSTVCNEYTQIIPGAELCGNFDAFAVKPLDITAYMTSKITDSFIFAGQITFSSEFTRHAPDNCDIVLSKKETVDGKAVFVDVANCTVTGSSSGNASFTIGDVNGVEIDKYATYKITVRYGSFYNNPGYTLCETSEYELSGKRLLKLREDYRILDLFIGWFGKDHFTVKAIITVMELLVKIKLLDGDYVKDVKNYVKAK